MSNKHITASFKGLNIATRIVLVLGIFWMAAFGAFTVRMQKGPIDLDFAKSRIEAALSDSESGYEVKIGKIALTWPEMVGPVLLDLRDVRIEQKESTGLSVENVEMGLSGIHLFAGKILPSLIIIDAPTFQLVKSDGSLNFFWQKEKKEEAVSEDKEKPNAKEIRTSVQDFFENITDPKNQEIDAFAALKRFEIKRAVITGKEFQKEGLEYLALVDLSLQKHDLGLQGDLTISLPGEEGKTAGLKSDILYRREQKDMTFTADVTDINPARFAAFFPDVPNLKDQNLHLSGAVKVAFDSNLRPMIATLNLQVPDGHFFIPEEYEEPITLKDVSFEAMLNRGEGILDVTTFNGVIGGIGVQAKTKAKIERGHVQAPIEITIPELPMEKVSPVFPKSARDSSAAEWLTYKLSDGRLYDVVISTNLDIKRDFEAKTREVSATGTKAAFKSEGLTVKYSDTLMAVKDVRAEGSYENDVLTVMGEHGMVGDITGKNVKLKITDLTVKGGGKADINLDASGPLSTALEYASAEPISVGDKLDFDVKTAKGNVSFNLQLNFPTLKDLPKEEVVVTLKGTANDILLPNVVQGLPLTGGPYDLGYKDGMISLKGSGQLAQRPITLEWNEYFDPTGKDFESKITAKITADDGLRKAFGIGLEEYISGPLPVDVVYLDKGVTASIDVKGNLAPTTLHIKPFRYKKKPEIEGSVTLKAFMKGDTLEEVDQLELSTKEFSISKGRILFRKLKDGSTDVSKGSIPAAELGKTKVNVDFEVTPNNELKVLANGSIVDLAPFIDRKKNKSEWAEPEEKEEDKPIILSVSGDKMLAHDGESLRNTKIYMETNNTGDITRLEMDSDIGEGNMYLRFKPEAETGKRTFRLESTDAGYTLKAFGLYDKARGGKLTIYGQPAKGDLTGDLYGSARMDNFHVKGAPALAKLLGAMSMVGVQNLLNNEGVSFARLESDFEWQFHDGGNFLVVKDGRTSGSSLGLTFDGSVDQAQDRMDISGTIVPVSGINNVIGQIPLIGNILTGGDALIAATYKIAGPTADPKVSVNPLSVLAPGFLRKILFESAPKTAPGAETPVQAPTVPKDQ